MNAEKFSYVFKVHGFMIENLDLRPIPPVGEAAGYVKSYDNLYLIQDQLNESLADCAIFITSGEIDYAGLSRFRFSINDFASRQREKFALVGALL